MLRTIVVVLCLLCMTACTSMQIVQSSPQQNLAGQLSAGDDVSLVTRDGKHYDLAITHVDANSLTGQDAHGKKWKVRREAIASQIGRGSGRGRVGQYVWISGVAVPLQKKKKKK